MIVSHKHKFIFIRPFKVAGTSLEYAMTPFLGADDIVCELGKDEEIKRLNKLVVDYSSHEVSSNVKQFNV